MGGYCYGESEPTEECGLCGGEAFAEFCDVGVGMVQMSPYHCMGCGASLNPRLSNGEYADGWMMPEQPSERGEKVTGYYITPSGHRFEMTFHDGHQEFNYRIRTTTSALLSRGWVRITNLEGFAVDLPPHMSKPTRRALKKTLEDLDNERRWGNPYVLASGADHGEEMDWRAVMSLVSRLPEDAITPLEKAPKTISIGLQL